MEKRNKISPNARMSMSSQNGAMRITGKDSGKGIGMNEVNGIRKEISPLELTCKSKKIIIVIRVLSKEGGAGEVPPPPKKKQQQQ